MRHNLRVVAVPFPKGLMSTARSPQTMPTTYARTLTNMLMAADGAGVKRNGVRAVAPLLPNGETVRSVMVFAGAVNQLMAVSSAGVIYRLDNGAWVSVWSGLNPAGVVRTVVFGGKLVLCNGFDPLMAYDGTSWQVVSTFVTEAGTGLAWVSASSFRVNSDIAFYPVGSRVRATVAGVQVVAHVASVSASSGVVTVVLDAAVLGAVAANLTAVAFEVKPPVMAYIAVAHDRLWGFGKGPLRMGLSGDVDRLRVFYTHGVNNPTAWPDPETGVVPSINLADKAGVPDELMAMVVKDGITVFFGRTHMQLWSGSNPVYTAESAGDFAWSKTIPLGVVHGNAVLPLPNDVLFISRTGARTLSRTVKTEQLDIADVGSELDPTVGALLTTLEQDASAYARVVGMMEPVQGWFGISMAGQTLVWQVGSFGSGWVVFSGLFADIAAACGTPDGALYVAVGGQVYIYDRTVYDDAGAPIYTCWQTPWLQLGNGRRWAGKYVEALLGRGAAVPLVVRRTVDDDDGTPVVLDMETPETPDPWDASHWDSAQWDSGNPGVTLVRDHTVGTQYAYALESNTTVGPVTVFGLKLYGVSEE